MSELPAKRPKLNGDAPSPAVASGQSMDSTPDGGRSSPANYSPTGNVYGPTAVAEELLSIAAHNYTSGASPARPSLSRRQRFGGDALVVEVVGCVREKAEAAGLTRIGLLRAIDDISGKCIREYIARDCDERVQGVMQRVVFESNMAGVVEGSDEFYQTLEMKCDRMAACRAATIAVLEELADATGFR